MNLYEINAELLECLDDDTGEIIDITKFDALNLERDAKIENICLWIKNLDAEVKALKAEKDVFEKRRKAAESKMNSLKKYLIFNLEGEVFETTKVKVSYRRSQKLNITDTSLIPEEFFKAPEVNISELKNAIKSGMNIAGAEIVEELNMQIK